MTAALTLDRVEMVFGGLRAVGGVSFEVPKGSIFGLIGPNGAGKTTVFNCITGVYVPTRGAVAFEGRRIDGLAAWKIADLGVARTFQNIRLFGQMSVLENVLVASHRTSRAGLFDTVTRSRRYHEDEHSMRARAEELLKLFGLTEEKDHPAAALPYGDQRRLEIARALMLSPRVLLLDEPAAGMNSAEAQVLKDQLRELRDRFELTVVLVEHNMQVVMSVCELVHVMDRGETIAHGPPDEVRAQPKVKEAYLGTGGGDHQRGPASTDEVLLNVTDLQVAYGGIKAVKNVSLEVHRGELVALVGANGAGKTSTLKAIAKLVPLAGGKVTLAGEDLSRVASHSLPARGMALSPEGRAIFANLTVKENLDLGAYCVRDKTLTRDRLAKVIALFSRLGERMSQLGGTLSGGEQQMLAIARALMSGPKLLMLDEPSLGIAPVLVDQIFVAIEEIRREGTTILLVEQNTRRALAAAQRAYVMVTGEVALSGDAETLSHDPRVQSAYLGDGATVA